MAGNNDFLPIGTAAGAPVLSNSSWAGAVPANARGAGILPKEWFNKALRQSSSMSAAIGQFIANAGQNANDNADIPALTAAFAAALGSAAAGAQAFYSLRVATGAAASRVIALVAGTYQISLETRVMIGDPGTYDITATQSASIGTTTVSNSVRMFRLGGSGYGRFMERSGLAVGSLTVGAPGNFTMSIAAATLGGLSSNGTIMTCERLA